MPEWLAFITLGVVQGLTEFLPVSSTGHLILAHNVLRIEEGSALAVDAVLHLATALAVLVYFRSDIARLARSCVGWVTGKGIEASDRVLTLALVVGTVPAVVCGFLLQSSIESTFRSPHLVAYALIAGSALFFIAERLASQQKTLSVSKGILVGFFQALALIPGVSRSGATISGGLLLGLSREAATRFAFLLSFPVILGAGLLKLFELEHTGVLAQNGGEIALAAAAAFFSGMGAIYVLVRFLKTNTLDVFIVYRLVLAALILTLL